MVIFNLVCVTNSFEKESRYLINRKLVCYIKNQNSFVLSIYLSIFKKFLISIKKVIILGL